MEDAAQAPPEQPVIAPPADPWRAFLEPQTAAEFLRGWLAIAAGRLEHTTGAVLFLRGDGGRLGLAAHWQMPAQDAGVTTLAEALARSPEPLVKREETRSLLGYPVEVAGELQAVLVLQLSHHPDGAAFRRLMRELHWSGGWLENRIWQGHATLGRKQAGSAQLVLQLLSATAEHRRFDGAALALVNAVPDVTGMDQAALGTVKRRRVRLEAISRMASFSRRSERARAWEAAMDEAYAQGDIVAIPAPDGARRCVDAAHRALAQELGAAAVISAPMMLHGQVVGVLTLARDATAGAALVPADVLDDLRLVAAALAPLMDAKLRERRLVSGRLRDLAGRALTAVFGRRPALALAALGLGLALVLPFVITTNLRVGADATVEGAVQQTIVAPVDGFIASAGVRAGDRVLPGALMARLDDQDLRLEHAAATARATRAKQSQRDALALGDRTASAVASAELTETLATLDLINAQLSRLDIIAPIAGLVVSGDLSQRIGTPVRRGEDLFEVAAESGWRLRIEVSEYDLALVHPAATGTAVFAGLSGIAVPFEVTNIAAVSDPGGGENRFQVEAAVTNAPPALRPGLQGTAKIEAGRSTLAWVWLRGTAVRLRLFAWQFLP
ncbi:HlyD family efflux transporter periplasmic adaptor subunit [Pseudorhodobacter sp.]|uniref:HlyD family efflux transporter periplasmic adaptor subunit n=1 Tax=Pseudorhodobacter sp. TaxID=1934400 RepID=UPI002AFFB62F|nr:HlyD family efflux transporter periplasmic adaptor subunit [Pseudorhodobacter sp.]